MRGLDGLGFAPGVPSSYEGSYTDFSWMNIIPPYFPPNGGGGGGTGSGYPTNIPCVDDWSCTVVPILKQVVTRTGRPCFAEWYGEVKGLDANQNPISLGSDGHNTQTAEQMLKAAAVAGIIYAMWQETIRRFNPDGTTVTVGRYDRNTGMVTVSDGYQGGTGTYYPTVPNLPTVYNPTVPTYPTQSGIGGIDQNTLLLLAGGGLLIWALTRRK